MCRATSSTRTPSPVSLVLGGDAQTLSWSYVLTDFPFLMKSNSASSAAIAAATGDVDLLHADVFKVSHHASKRGVNLELVERINPRVTVISCGPDSPRYHFPHEWPKRSSARPATPEPDPAHGE